MPRSKYSRSIRKPRGIYRSARPADSSEKQLNYIMVPIRHINGRATRSMFMLVKRNISKSDANRLAKKWRDSSPGKLQQNSKLNFRHLARIISIGGNRYNLYLGGNYEGSTDSSTLGKVGFKVIR